MTELLLAVVPTPMTASGAVSGGDLEKYIHWLRGAAIDGVLIWSAVGGGKFLDLAEREELYSVWRAGLLPRHQVWAQVPAGGLPATPQVTRFQSAHAREMGADGIVAELRTIQANGLRLSAAAALGLPFELETHLEGLEEEPLTAVLLGVLARWGVISTGGTFSPAGITAQSPGIEHLQGILDLLSEFRKKS